MRPPNKILAGILLIGGMALWQCGTGGKDYPNANVILISIDTLRADHLPAYGYAKVETPAVDALAAGGVLFSRAYSQYPLTLPSHATLFTGKLPTAHGVRDNLNYRLDPAVETLAQSLSRKGYATAGFVSAMVIGKRTGIGSGFEIYHSEVGAPNGDLLPSWPGELTLAKALSWLKKPRQQPFFLFVHLYEPHAPYDPPEPFASQYAGSPYDGEIAYSDHLLGGFLRELKNMGLYEGAIITLLSDHGEGLDDHGELEHGVFLYREALHVPLIMKLPRGDRAGTRFDHPCGLMDVKPTLEALVGIASAENDGRPLLHGGQGKNRLIYAESYYPLYGFGFSPLKSVIRGRDHYIRSNREELYDLDADPLEKNNLIPEVSPPAEMIAFLERLGEGQNTRGTDTSEDLELLASLGYTALSGKVERRLDRDLSELTRDLKDLQRAKTAMDSEQMSAAEPLLLQLLARNPCLHEGRLRLSQIMAGRGDDAGLEKLYEDGLACDPNHLPFLMLLTDLKLKLGKFDEAGALTQFVWETGPQTAKDELSFYYFKAGQADQALLLVDQILESFPRAPFAHYVRAKHELDGGLPQQAVSDFQIAAEAFAESQNVAMRALALHYLGEAHQHSDAAQAAIGAYREALSIRPNTAETRVALSLLLGATGQVTEAIRVMDEWVADFPSQKNYLTASQTMRKLGLDEPAAFYRDQSEHFQ